MTFVTTVYLRGVCHVPTSLLTAFLLLEGIREAIGEKTVNAIFYQNALGTMDFDRRVNPSFQSQQLSANREDIFGGQPA